MTAGQRNALWGDFIVSDGLRAQDGGIFSTPLISAHSSLTIYY